MSQPFNSQNSEHIFLAGMVESWGRGIEKYLLHALMPACQYLNLKMMYWFLGYIFL